MIRVGRLSSLVAIGVMTIGVMAPGSARAQEPGTVGITMGYPASVGVVWDASKTIAIRPTVTFAGASTGSTAASGGSSNWNLGTTISALLYMKKYDHVRTFVSPSYRYSHSSTTIRPSSSAQPAVSNADTSSNSNGASGTFGAEYAPVSRVRIYAEAGFAYTHITTSSSISGALSPTANSWGTTAGVGFVFYP